jgi:hypothetical protein
MKRVLIMSILMTLLIASYSFAQMGQGHMGGQDHMMGQGHMGGQGKTGSQGQQQYGNMPYQGGYYPCRMGQGMMGYGGYGMMGPGMMHGGYGMGPGMMGHHQMMHGGCGMGPGMMGYGEQGMMGHHQMMHGGYGMGPGMMGYGGQGMMGHHQMMHGGYGMGPGMMGYGMGPGSMGGYRYEANQKFLSDTADLRKELHNKKFEYFEAVRNPDTKPDTVKNLEKEIWELQKKISDKWQR